MIGATVRIVVKETDTQSRDDIYRLLNIWLVSNLHALIEVIDEEAGIADTLDFKAAYVQKVENER